VNLILLFDEDFTSDDHVRLFGRRAKHVHEVHRAAVGDELVVGRLGGRIGRGRVLSVSRDEVSLAVELVSEPPAPSPVSLILAMPRPKMLKKVLQAIASLGIKRLVLLNSFRVEKSYFDSPLLAEARVREHLLLGLEQGRDTVLPEVLVRRRFKPFVEDELEGFCGADSKRLIAHPIAENGIEGCEVGSGAEPAVVAIGPEGGWIPYEVELFEQRGFQRFTLGQHILRVDTAVPYVVGQVDLARRLARLGGGSRLAHSPRL
jgi:RsmE family RNA methyltransferase